MLLLRILAILLLVSSLTACMDETAISSKCKVDDDCSGDLICHPVTEICKVNPCKGYEDCGGGGTCDVSATTGEGVCSCKTGYQLSDEDPLICRDRCEGIDCSGHGTCTPNGNGEPQCDCDDGYQEAGLSCVAFNPCKEIDCNGHGTCSSVNGAAQCSCDEGYINSGVLNCVDPCSGVLCSEHGVCSIVNGEPSCTCDEGYLNDGATNCVTPCKVDSCGLYEVCTPETTTTFRCEGPCDDLSCDADSSCTATSESDASCVCDEGYRDLNGFCVQKEIVERCENGVCDIPAGWFWMGCNLESGCDADEQPYHAVYLDHFKIDQYEVTAAQFKECVDAGGCSKDDFQDFNETNDLYFNYHTEYTKNRDRFPMNGVNWNGADAYCRSIGKRLPTEAEWEKAARGTDERLYPWGEASQTCEHAVTSISGVFACGYTNPDYSNDFMNTYIVGGASLGKSPYGLYDMAGNVSEWVNDWYGSYSEDIQSNPEGPESGSTKIIRGGDGESQSISDIYTFNRRGLGQTDQRRTVGFRCAQSVE